MYIDSEKKIINLIQLIPPVFVVISSLLIMIFLYIDTKNNLNKETKNIKENFIKNKKKEIKHQVQMVEKFIKNSKKELSSNFTEEQIQQKIINEIKKFEYQKDRYIFIIDYDSNVLVHINKEFLDKNMFEYEKSEKRKSEIRDIIAFAKTGGGYLTYTQFTKPSTKELVDKTSFILGLNDWKWFIGTGFYHDDINSYISKKKEDLEIYYKQQLLQSIIITICSVIAILILSLYFSKIVKQRFTDYKKEINKNIKEKEEYTKLLHQQSKLASIGEMIKNIAHQWRQPLTVISMSANNMKADIALDEVKIDSFKSDIDDILVQTQYLTNTIEDFRNFFNQGSDIQGFNLKNAVEKTLSLIGPQFRDERISIMFESQDVYIKGAYSEFVQVLINILNNSKDAFKSLDDFSEKNIFINIEVQEDVKLSILDNAGGIDKSIIDKVFEPYTTTKHQSSGTGIGLYMANEIIDKHMNGKIQICNVDFEYEDKSYKGTKLEIVLPIGTK